MKKLVILFVSLFVLVIAAKNASAQYDKSATANATATIITPIDITKSTDLSFGNIIASGTTGTVTVDLNNTRTRTDGASFPSVPGTISSAEFTVTGLTGTAYTVTLPNNGQIKLSGTGKDMELTGFTHNASGTLTTGSETFKVGATLNVDKDQAAGSYAGSFPVIVNYN